MEDDKNAVIICLSHTVYWVLLQDSKFQDLRFTITLGPIQASELTRTTDLHTYKMV